MAKRKDGEKTRQKIVDTACEVFAQKGYRDAKVAEICRRAGVNVASVNYYFGDKASLYVTAWQQAMEKAIPPHSHQESSNLPPEERLRVLIRNSIQKILNKDESGFFTRMELMEMANPTGLIDKAFREFIEPRRMKLIQLIRDIIGPGASEETVLFCELSVVDQCRGYFLSRKQRFESLAQETLTPELAEKLADHITRFSLAGIKAIRDFEGKPDKMVGNAHPAHRPEP